MTSPERVVVVGCGLIGTSVALAARRAGDAVAGVEIDPEHAATAARLIGSPVGASAAPITEATLVVVATPSSVVPRCVVDALRTNPEATVTDVASVKAPIIAAVSEAVHDAAALARFVPGHPMGGSERSGPATASAGFVDGATWVIAPHPAGEEERVAHVESWIRRLGAAPVRVAPDRHDRLVATVSHLPQIASTTLMALAADREAGEPDALLLAAGGFRDLTRLAASSPELWGEILTANRDEVLGALDAFVAALAAFREQVAANDRGGVERAFARGRAARLALGTKPRVRAGVGVLQVPIPDRPGALAALTAALVGVNIEDLQIVHSAEGGRGVVHLTVAEDDLEAAGAALDGVDASPVRIA